MPFVKVDCALRKNVRLQRISRSAEVVYRRSQELAQELADDGARVGFLEHHQLGPHTVSEIALQLYLPEKEVSTALKELVAAGLWEQGADGCISLPRFAEKTKPADPTAAERQKRFRDRKRNPSSSNGVTSRPSNGVTDRDVTEGVTPAVTAQKVEARTKKDPPLPPEGEMGRRERIPRPVSDPFGFADWFLGESLRLGLVDPLDDAARNKRVQADLKTAEMLLPAGVELCQARARRYLAALHSRELKKMAPTVRGLAKAWDIPLVHDPAPERRPGVRPGSFDDLPKNVPLL